MVRQTNLMESATRKKIDRILLNLGWIIDEEDPACNVTTEVPKTKAQKEILKRREGDYFLYKSGTDEIIAIIETKRPDENIKDALNQGIDLYATPLDVNIVFATDGTIIETYHLKDKTELKKDKESITELLSEKELLNFVERAEIESPQTIKYTKQELIKIFQRANNLLRKDGLREGIERFTEFSNILFIKMISEIEDERESQDLPRRFAKRYCWDSFKDKNGDEILDHINDTILPRLVENYNASGDVFQSELKIKNPETIKEIVNKLSKLTLLDLDSDVKGDAFEYFLKESVTVGNDLGEYFTPRHIVKLMVKLVDPKFGDTVYDPCCGTGGFLIEAYKHIWKKCKHNEENLDKLQNKTIYGRELTGTAKIAKMNMILAGDGHTNIRQIDSLASPLKEEYDVVLTNFPFSQQTDYGNLYGFNTEDANPIFIKHIIDALKDKKGRKEGGKGVIVSFQGVLYDKSDIYVKIRRFLLENCEVEGIIKLHNYVFRPYTGVNTSIIIFKKGSPTKKVWFFTVDEDGFEKTSSKKGKKPIVQNDLKLLLEIFDSKEETEKSWSVDIDTIKENNYSLNAELYKPVKSVDGRWNLVKVIDFTDTKKGFEVGSKTYCTNDKGVPFFRVGDLTGKGKLTYTNSEKKVGVKQSDILMSFDGTIGVVRRGLNGAISAGIRKIKSNSEDQLLDDYLFYALQGSKVKETLKRHTKESTIIHAGKAINHIKIPLPPLTIQKKVANSLNNKQEKIEKISELLKTYSKEIIEPSFFVDKNFESLSNLIVGEPQNGIYKSKEHYGEGTPIIRIDNIYDGQLVVKNIKKLRLTKEELETYGLNKNDIILNRVNSEDYIGKCCIYDNEFSDCVYESNMMRFKVDENKILPRYVIYYLSSKKGKTQILSKIKRAINQVSINQGDVKSLKIPIISLKAQQKIVDEIEKQLTTINNLHEIKNSLSKQLQNEIDNLWVT